MPAIKMTELWCKQVKPGAAQRDYYDEWTPVPGQSGKLVLRVGKSGVKSWLLMYRLNEVRSRFTLGHYPVLNLSEARKEATGKLSAIIKGHDPAAERREGKAAPTFKELSEVYLKFHARKAKKEKSVREDQRIIEKDLLPVWGWRKAESIKRREVMALLDTIAERGPIMANRTLALASKIFNVAIDRELLEFNPCFRMTKPGEEKQRERVLSDTEIKAVWVGFDNLTGSIGQLFKLVLLTAQRIGEVSKMRWADIDLSAGWWTIPKEFAKNNLSHRVPLSPPAIEILLELKEKAAGSDWVFPTKTGSSGHMTSFQKAAQRVKVKIDAPEKDRAMRQGSKRAKEQPGVNDFKLHDLRRTAASYMTGMGIPRLTVSMILNHVEKGVTRVYDRHSYDNEKKAALDRWAQRLEQIITGEKAKILSFSSTPIAG